MLHSPKGCSYTNEICLLRTETIWFHCGLQGVKIAYEPADVWWCCFNNMHNNIIMYCWSDVGIARQLLRFQALYYKVVQHLACALASVSSVTSGFQKLDWDLQTLSSLMDNTGVVKLTSLILIL